MKFLKLFLALLLVLPASGQISRTVRVNTLAELAALPLPSINNNLSAIVKDVGVYTYSSASADSTNASGVVVAPLVGSGNWLRITPAKLGVNTGVAQLTNDFQVFGTSWLSDTVTVPKVVGGNQTSSDLILQTSSGVGAAGADMHFLVGNNGATEAMTILNNGNVGVGAVAPLTYTSGEGIQIDTRTLLFELDVNNGSYLSQNLEYNGSWRTTTANTASMLALVGNTLTYYIAASGGVGGTTAILAKLFIDASGNTGIGTTGPLAKFAVNGGVHVGGDSDPGDNNLLVDGTTTSTGALTVTLGNATVTNGNLLLGTAGNGLQIKEGSNARMGTATLSGGTITVANTSAVTGDRIFIQRVSGTSAEFGHLSYSINTGVEFTITSTDAQDDSVVNWLIIKPTP